jgi:hypothetical protein
MANLSIMKKKLEADVSSTVNELRVLENSPWSQTLPALPHGWVRSHRRGVESPNDALWQVRIFVCFACEEESTIGPRQVC